MTKQSSWDKPDALKTPEERASTTEWKEYKGADGRDDFFNTITTQGVWTMPKEWKKRRGAEWTEHIFADGRRYYFNKVTKRFSWDELDALKAPEERANTTEWKEYKSADGRDYFFNTITKQSVCTMPKELEKLRGLPTSDDEKEPPTEVVDEHDDVVLDMPVDEPVVSKEVTPPSSTTEERVVSAEQNEREDLMEAAHLLVQGTEEKVAMAELKVSAHVLVLGVEERILTVMRRVFGGTGGMFKQDGTAIRNPRAYTSKRKTDYFNYNPGEFGRPRPPVSGVSHR